MGGNVTNEGGAKVTEQGVCYIISVNPTTADNKVEMGSGAGAFSLPITGLTAGTTYYARAYGILGWCAAYKPFVAVFFHTKFRNPGAAQSSDPATTVCDRGKNTRGERGIRTPGPP